MKKVIKGGCIPAAKLIQVILFSFILAQSAASLSADVFAPRVKSQEYLTQLGSQLRRF